ncbi:MAG: aminomethyl transferase family protein, partial [Candidatus Krumholzibacteria bacterium]|nr:aminomethyl transferase family protein [Candidatus Krumholzibacteria bacterium]
MPIATPFHPRTLARCTSLFYKDWAGYHAVRSYDTSADREYFAFRHACGLIDVTPLYKYDVRGEDAARFLARVMVRDIMKLKLRQVMYVCWCDDDGHMIDDGTVSRLGDDHYR